MVMSQTFRLYSTVLLFLFALAPDFLQAQNNAEHVIYQLKQAINSRDLDTVHNLLDPDYRSIYPADPGRSYQGRETAKQRWQTLLQGSSEFYARILRMASSGNAVWSEWHWKGTDLDGIPYEGRGVIIFGIRDNKITRGRYFVMPATVEEGTGNKEDEAIENRWD